MYDTLLGFERFKSFKGIHKIVLYIKQQACKQLNQRLKRPWKRP